MRTLFFAIGMMCAMATAAQPDKYTKTMLANIAQIDSAKTEQQKLELSNTFERIAKAEKDKWQPYYYAAMLQILRTYQIKSSDKNNIDAILDQADNLLISAELISPNNAEVMCLKAMALTARISVDPQARGAQYSQQSTDVLKKAAEINPNNPRIYLLMAQNIFYTPDFWGGGKEKAKPIAEKSVQLFDAFEPASEIDPNWGKTTAKLLLEKCNA